MHRLRIFAAEVGRPWSVDPELGVRAGLFADVEIVGRGERLAVIGPEMHQAVGLRVGKRLDDQRAQAAENCRGGPDADGERENRHGGEAGRLGEGAEGEAEIVHGGVKQEALSCKRQPVGEACWALGFGLTASSALLDVDAAVDGFGLERGAAVTDRAAEISLAGRICQRERKIAVDSAVHHRRAQGDSGILGQADLDRAVDGSKSEFLSGGNVREVSLDLAIDRTAPGAAAKIGGVDIPVDGLDMSFAAGAIDRNGGVDRRPVREWPWRES